MISGAGNPVGGSNPAGTGTGLNYIGNHAYGYSGIVNSASQDENVTLMSFTTGSHYVVCEVQFAMKHDTSDNIGFAITMHGQTISGYTIRGGVGDAQLSNAMPLIIPPFTKIECIGVNNSSGSARPLTVTIAGRVYA